MQLYAGKFGSAKYSKFSILITFSLSNNLYYCLRNLFRINLKSCAEAGSSDADLEIAVSVGVYTAKMGTKMNQLMKSVSFHRHWQ